MGGNVEIRFLLALTLQQQCRGSAPPNSLLEAPCAYKNVDRAPYAHYGTRPSVSVNFKADILSFDVPGIAFFLIVQENYWRHILILVLPTPGLVASPSH